ncbi:MAG: hypothetical protein MRK02_06300 [Candidatus Scalindua sp.]|nr:hypothetical protein [Candidatus Scalindua sp.]
MAKTDKDKKVYKNGFNLFEAYPIQFSEKVETVPYDEPAEAFNFPFPDKNIAHIMVNLCPTEPWALPHVRITENNPREFFSKLDRVRTRYFGGSHCHAVISSHEIDLIKEVKEFTWHGDWLHTYLLDPIYPHDAPVLLLKKILGLHLAYGQDTRETGVLILEPQAVAEIFEHYIRGNECSTRLIPLSGTGLGENKILKVKPGTPIQAILDGNVRENITCRVFVDGPLNGSEVKDMRQRIGWTTKNIVILEERDYKTPFSFFRLNELVFTTSLMGELRRCVYCNHCDDMCPVNLEPALYWQCHTRGEKQRARLYGLEKCIECGLCSFICPSKLELLQIIKECKLADSGSRLKDETDYKKI